MSLNPAALVPESEPEPEPETSHARVKRAWIGTLVRDRRSTHISNNANIQIHSGTGTGWGTGSIRNGSPAWA